MKMKVRRSADMVMSRSRIVRPLGRHGRHYRCNPLQFSQKSRYQSISNKTSGVRIPLSSAPFSTRNISEAFIVKATTDRIIESGYINALTKETKVFRHEIKSGQIEIRVEHTKIASDGKRRGRTNSKYGSKNENVDGGSDILRASIQTSLDSECDILLHWGLIYDDSETWICPNKSTWPENVESKHKTISEPDVPSEDQYSTVAVNCHAAETRMLHRGRGQDPEARFVNFVFSSNSHSQIHNPMYRLPKSLRFVLTDEAHSCWINNCNCDFEVPLAKAIQVENSQDEHDGDREDHDHYLNTVVSAMFPFPWNHKDDDDVQSESSTTNKERKTTELVHGRHPISYERITEQMIKTNLKIRSDGNCVELHVSLSDFDNGIRSSNDDKVYLHWGVGVRGASDPYTWHMPPKSIWPTETTEYVGNGSGSSALRTLMTFRDSPCDNRRTLSAHILSGFEPSFIFFVIYNSTTNQWYYADHRGSDFVIPLPDVIMESAMTNKSRSTKKGASSSKNVFKRLNAMNSHALPAPVRRSETNTSEYYDRFDSAPQYQIVLPANPIKSRRVRLKPFQHSSCGTGREIVLQGFNWESWRRNCGNDKWYTLLEHLAEDIDNLGFSMVWFPPPTDSVSPQGYMPRDLYDLNCGYGNEKSLKRAIKALKKKGIGALADCVINHRCASSKGCSGVYNQFGGKLDWGSDCIVRDDPHYHGSGNRSTGDHFGAAPNIDHCNEKVRRDLSEWINWLLEDIGFTGFRLDFARGFGGQFVREYISKTEPHFSVGEYWDSLDYRDGKLHSDQDHHRRRILDWIHQTGGLSAAFDVTTKGILHEVLAHREYWRLRDRDNRPPGLIGLWPSRAVTFLENHDTGSTQQHWPFPRHHIMEGYCYILTHPGTPSIFFDHCFTNTDSKTSSSMRTSMQDEIGKLIELRQFADIDCRSPVRILVADNWRYAAEIGEHGRLCMKIGPGDWAPVGDCWKLATFGTNYAVWFKN